MFKQTFLIVAITFIFGLSNSTQAQQINPSLSKFIQKKRDHNANSKKGISVLLYNGNEQEARNIYNKLRNEFENIHIKLTYVSPDWKVLTDSYSSRLEAERVSIIIREKHADVKIL